MLVALFSLAHSLVGPTIDLFRFNRDVYGTALSLFKVICFNSFRLIYIGKGFSMKNVTVALLAFVTLVVAAPLTRTNVNLATFTLAKLTLKLSDKMSVIVP